MAKTILIFEKNELNLKLFNDILQANSYKTILTSDERNSLSLAKVHHPDLIIMGIQFPSASDLEVAKLMKSDDILSTTPIIAVTALTMKHDEEKIRNCGCDGYITKPISIPEFLDTIQSFLN